MSRIIGCHSVRDEIHVSSRFFKDNAQSGAWIQNFRTQSLQRQTCTMDHGIGQHPYSLSHNLVVLATHVNGNSMQVGDGLKLVLTPSNPPEKV